MPDATLRARPCRDGYLWLGCAAVAFAYFAAARLALLLAIPPGYATAVWPAAGIALLAVQRLGTAAAVAVAIGSFTANCLNDPGAHVSAVRACVAAAVIGGGAGLQAWFGARLLARHHRQSDLTTLRDIARFVVLAGPIGCLPSATVGVTTLWSSGLMPGAYVPFSWFTWWCGDTIGALLVATVAPCALPGASSTWRKRRASVAVPMFAAAIAAILSYLQISASEHTAQQLEFERRAVTLTQAVRNRVGESVRMLDSVDAFFHASRHVDRREFSTFVRRSMAQLTGVQAFEWIPRVGAADRAAHEREVVADGLHAYTITERDAAGALVPAAPRDEYFPVCYLEPLSGNEHALGFDLGSETMRRSSLETARDTGTTVATTMVSLVQPPSQGQGGFLVFKPVYRPVDPESAAARRDALTGFVVAVFQFGHLIEAGMRGLDALSADLVMRVRDTGAGHSPLATLLSGHTIGADVGEAPSPLRFVEPLEVGTRRWDIEVLPSPAYVSRQRTWAPWTFLSVALMLIVLLGMFLLSASGRTVECERLVAERTQQLDALNAQLAARVTELDQFTYMASHDLQEPLRKLQSFCALLRQDAGTGLGNDALDDLHHITDSSQRMQILIEDLLSFSRAGNAELREREVELEACVVEALTNLEATVATTRAEIRCDPLPTVFGDPRLLVQLLQNLLGNALKYRRPGVAPNVHVFARGEGDTQAIVVADDGIGIPPQYAQLVFEPFKRLHGRDQYPGTGIGLAICKKVVERHGGAIRVEPAPGGGALFVFTVAAARVRTTHGAFV